MASMLRHLRDEAKDSDGPVFWIDSICVDSSDTEEKSVQAAPTTKSFREPEPCSSGRYRQMMEPRQAR